MSVLKFAWIHGVTTAAISPGPVIFWGALAVFVLLFIRNMVKDLGRPKRMKAFAEQIGFSYQKGGGNLARGLKMPPFNDPRTESRETSCRLSGEWQKRSMDILDYDYEVPQSGRRSRWLRQTVVVLQSDALDLPEFALTPKSGFAGWMTERNEQQRIDFPEDKDFSRKLVLTGKVESEVRRFFTSSVRRVLAENRDVCVAGEGTTLALHCRKLLKPDAIVRLRDLAGRLAEEFAGKEVDQTVQAESATDAAPTADGDAQDELGRFLSQPPPRTLSPWIRQRLNAMLARWHIGRGLYVVPVMLLILVGIPTTAAVYMQYNGAVQWLGLLAMLPGAIPLVLVARYRRRFYRLLRKGELANGTIEQVRGTRFKVVSGAGTGIGGRGLRRGLQQHKVVVSYNASGCEHTGSVGCFGKDVERATRQWKKEATVSVLYNPDDFQQLVLVESLGEEKP